MKVNELGLPVLEVIELGDLHQLVSQEVSPYPPIRGAVLSEGAWASSPKETLPEVPPESPFPETRLASETSDRVAQESTPNHPVGPSPGAWNDFQQLLREIYELETDSPNPASLLLRTPDPMSILSPDSWTAEMMGDSNSSLMEVARTMGVEDL